MGLTIIMLPLVLAGAGQTQAPAVPPPVEQQTADCAAPAYATDQLVCGDPALRAADNALAVRLGAAPVPDSRWAEAQRAWFLRRSRCAFVEDHRGCAEAAYRERRVLLDPPPDTAWRRKATCDSPDIASVAITGDWIVLIGPEGDVRGAAWKGAATPDWQPFLAASVRGRKLSFTTAAGDTLRCRIAP
jgi:uncharacterized protein